MHSFPYQYKGKVMLTFSLARMYDAPKPSNGVLTTHGAVLLQMHISDSKGKRVCVKSGKGRSVETDTVMMLETNSFTSGLIA